MNPRLQKLHPYPFEKLAQLKIGISPPAHLRPILMSMGEPQHEYPPFVREIIDANLAGLSKYPLTIGSPDLRMAIADWVSSRFRIAQGLVDPEQNVLPVNGTREALFSIVQCVVDTSKEDPLVLMPNPFYQIYEGATLLAGAKPYYINASADTGWNPDYDSIPEDIWRRCQILFICQPGNPTGSVLSYEMLNKLVEKAELYDFIIVSDECYSEIYFDDLKPPPGLLEVCAESGRGKFERCLVFHSLSKRSSLPGLRSGFVAGDADVLRMFKLYRTYHGCAMSPTYQAVSTAAWRDEKHVIENRLLYRKKFAETLEILKPVAPQKLPAAGFYLWMQTPIPDEDFTQGLFKRYNLTVLPGSYLSRNAHGTNPGANHVRLALVATLEETIEASIRLRDYMMEINSK